jgi:hypothetical protein
LLGKSIGRSGNELKLASLQLADHLYIYRSSETTSTAVQLANTNSFCPVLSSGLSSVLSSVTVSTAAYGRIGPLFGVSLV